MCISDVVWGFFLKPSTHNIVEYFPSMVRGDLNRNRNTRNKSLKESVVFSTSLIANPNSIIKNKQNTE